MNRILRSALGLCTLSALVSPIVAAPIVISGVGATFVSGDTFAFDVIFPPLTDLASYNVDVVLESPTGTAGTDFFFDIAATVPAGTNYVFSSDVNFFDAANVDSPSVHRLSLTDFDLSGVDVATGVNDVVAHVAVTTSAGFLGPLTIRVDADGLILDTPAVEPTSVEQFRATQTDTENAPSVVLDPVPEPASIMIAITALPLVLRFRRGPVP
jgi:hypothetical protein